MTLGILKRHFFGFMLAILFGAVLSVIGSKYVSAEAGSGGGGGSTGCSSFNHSTCYGAVWRYYKTTSNNYPIKNVGPGYTYARGCSSSGGFFAYVLPDKRWPHNPAGDMSWGIGSSVGKRVDTSIYFGGYTNYRIYSRSSDPIVTNPVSRGEYSWYSVKKAFAEAVSRGQGNGYRWNQYSELGWFCYSGVNFDLTPTITATPKATFGTDTASIYPTINNSKASTSSTSEWEVVRFIVQPGNQVKDGGDSSSAPEQYFPGAAVIKSGSQKFPKNVTNLATINQDVNDYAIGTRICYALSVHPYSQNNNNWRHSNPFCIVVGKKPKTQIWGGDLDVGRTFGGQATSTEPNIVTTSTTTKGKSVFATVEAPQSAFSGLWNTGVDGSGGKLGSNKPDPHWNLVRIVRPSGQSGATCQKGVNASGAVVNVPTSGTTGFPARTIHESGNRAGYTAKAPNPLIGNETPGGVNANNGKTVWGRVSSNARWISQNYYGQNYSTSTCRDPTYPPYHTVSNLGRSNIYVFRLKDGFTIDKSSGVNLDSVKLMIRGGADNGVRFVVNGKYVDKGWQYPGWSRNSSAKTTVSKDSGGSNIFKYGKNTLEIYIQSNYSHTGLLIDELKIEATMQKQISSPHTFGSWIEYGIFAPGAIKGAASNSAFAGPEGMSNATACRYSVLSFTNNKNGSCSASTVIGHYKSSQSIPSVSSSFPESASTISQNSVRPNDLIANKGVYSGTRTGNLTLQASELASGKSVILRVGGTVTINGNLTYNSDNNGDGYENISQIPQLVIMANKIIINSNVTSVDAWLIADGEDGIVETCNTGSSTFKLSGGDRLTINKCKDKLTVNGPVMAKQLWLRRTAGSGAGTASGDPAEVFNLRADAYLWAAARSIDLGRAQTVYSAELPPRF